MFTRMLAADTKDDGVTVNAVSPYVMENSDEFPEDAPRGRWASFEDVAQAVRFFCDEDSAYISGRTSRWTAGGCRRTSESLAGISQASSSDAHGPIPATFPSSQPANSGTRIAEG